uniref:tetratricopeptide repeat protein n=1 Tax=Streptomyces sp. F2 TaxID=317660 RepID=UPI0015E83BF7|nr:tetratricopeptide repeat protein [Streptomyces sp. F2]
MLQAGHATDAAVGPAPGPGTPASKSEEGAGVLMLVDYAERWPTPDLLEVCADALRQGHRARVLLVARPAGAWWQTMSHQIENMDIEVSLLPLQPLAEDLDISPRVLFTSAGNRFAAAMGLPLAGALKPPPAVLENPEFRQVLAVHMAALAMVDAERIGQQGEVRSAGGPADISAYLLTRERTHWQKLQFNGRIRISADAMAHTAYAAALIGPQSYTTGLEAIARVEIGSHESGDQILKDHAIPYPSPFAIGSDGRVTVLEPLYPDRIAEDFIALTLPGHSVHTYPPDPWATDAVQRLIDPDSSSSTSGNASQLHDWPRNALTVLAAAASRWPHVIKRQLTPLIARDPQLAIRAGGAALAAIADLPELEPEVLDAIEPHLPDRDIDLDPGSAVVAYRLTRHRLAYTQNPLHHALLRDELAKRLFHAGLYREALMTTQDSVRAWRHVVANEGKREADLAGALIDLGIFQAQMGLLKEAIITERESADILRRLPTLNADDQAALAIVLNNLSNSQSQQGLLEDALISAREAVDIARRLTQTESAEYEPELALTLDNFGCRLSTMGLFEEAVTVAREAVAIQRRLSGPAATLSPRDSELAAALTNFAARLAEIGQLEEGLDAAREAIGLIRRLAEANPAAYEHELAGALNNFGINSSMAGHREEALVPASEAVDLYRRLAESNPPAYEPDLAMALINLCTCLSRLSRHDEALSPARESLAIRRRLARGNPTAYDRDLAMSLNTLGICLSLTDNHEEALDSAQEAVDLFRRLAEGNPPAYESDLAMALTNLSNFLALAGYPLQALNPARESVDIRRRLATGNPSVYEPDLALGLYALADRHLEADVELSVGLRTAEEAVGIYRRLVPVSPRAYDYYLEHTLHVQADLLDKLGRHEEAARIRRLASDTPDGPVNPGNP